MQPKTNKFKKKKVLRELGHETRRGVSRGWGWVSTPAFQQGVVIEQLLGAYRPKVVGPFL